ncbi:ras guanine nucleotide exchange factor domain-containing protein [Lipomyces arxii]|uniref:ras guanine nucleotide exchange factor domain-containing protein n=1 Tax=Lipomyces arxii TaxID=56418 RepID=UPI0034CD91EC
MSSTTSDSTTDPTARITQQSTDSATMADSKIQSPDRPILFVRALYDYTSDDDTALEFKKGDVIAVILQLDTGWWDGQLNGNRGWFPSNYCESIEPKDLSPDLLASLRISDDEDEEYVDDEDEDDEEIDNAVINDGLDNEDDLDDQEEDEDEDEAEDDDDDDEDEDEDSEASYSNDEPLSPTTYRPDPVHDLSSTLGQSNLWSKERPKPGSRVQSVIDYGRTTFNRGLTWDDLQAAVITSVECVLSALRSFRKQEYRTHINNLLDCLATTMTAAGFPGFSVKDTDTLYHPPFRKLMTALGRLELAAEMALASDSSGAIVECEAECEHVITATAKLIRVARQDRPEPVGRLQPGFIESNILGGNWNGNGIFSQSSSPVRSSFSTNSNLSLDHFWGSQRSRENSSTSTLISLDESFLDTAEIQRTIIVNVARDLLRFLEQPYARTSDETVLIEKAARTMSLVRTYLALLESVDLSLLAKPLSPTVSDFRSKKQTLYDNISTFMLETQSITSMTDPAPSLARIERLRNAVKDLDTGVQTMTLTLQMLVEEKELRNLHGPDAVMPPMPVGDSRRPSEASAHSDASMLEYLNDIGDRSTNSSSTQIEKVANGNLSKSEQKIQQFFGRRPPYTTSVGFDDDVAWFLGNEYEDELVYDAKGNVKGGSLNGLMERLTRHDFLDPSFNTTFLLTYRSFTSSRTFFEMLIERFTIQPPKALTSEEFEIWVARKQKPIRLRVFNILKIWLEQYWLDGQDESEEESIMSRDILSALTAFSAQLMQQRFPGASSLAKLIQQRQQGLDVSKRLILNLGGSVPSPILPKRGLKNLKVTHIDALEFARQLTIMESHLYGRIGPLECLNRAWSTKRGSQASTTSANGSPAENIKRLILYSNQLTNWTAQCVLTQNDLKKRVNVIKHLINIADQCRQLNNFSSMTAIISALYSATIHRLNRTWEQIPHRSQVILDSLNNLMNSTRNFGEYRAMLHLVNPPCVPFFGVYLTDLTFIEDGNTDMLLRQVSDSPMINFSKRTKSAEVIREIQQYQSVPYALQPVQALQDMIREGLADAPSIETMYDQSLSIEPRERGDDDKISRLLQDSGFL